MSESDGSPIPAGQFAPAAPTPLPPTSPPVEPNRSKDVIQSDITVLREKMAGAVDHRERPGQVDALHKLYQELEGPNNVKKFELGRDPAAPPEKEIAPPAFEPAPAPQGREWDPGDLQTLQAVVAAHGDGTPAEFQAITQEFTRSYHRQGMDPDARIAAAVRELEQVWGPEDGARFQVQLDRAEQELARLHPSLVAQLKRVGGHWDAWSVKLLADVWQRRHPGA